MKILFLIFLCLSSSWAALDRTIQVQGNCDVKVEPDRGIISFTAENQSQEQQQAVSKTNEQINKLKEKIKALKLAELELKNTGYNVYPVRDYENNRYVDKGTRAALTLEVTTSEISRLGEVMVEASKIGIQHVGALTTFLSLEKSKQEYLKCLEVAALDAENKAQRLAKKLGFKLGDVMVINETPGTTIPSPVPYPGGMLKTATMDMATTNIEAGKQQFSTTLQVTFGIK